MLHMWTVVSVSRRAVYRIPFDPHGVRRNLLIERSLFILLNKKLCSLPIIERTLYFFVVVCTCTLASRISSAYLYCRRTSWYRIPLYSGMSLGQYRGYKNVIAFDLVSYEPSCLLRSSYWNWAAAILFYGNRICRLRVQWKRSVRFWRFDAFHILCGLPGFSPVLRL